MIVNINTSVIKNSLNYTDDIANEYVSNLSKLDTIQNAISTCVNRDDYISFMKKLDILQTNIRLFNNNLNDYVSYMKQYLLAYEKLDSSYVAILNSQSFLK